VSAPLANELSVAPFAVRRRRVATGGSTELSVVMTSARPELSIVEVENGEGDSLAMMADPPEPYVGSIQSETAADAGGAWATARATPAAATNVALAMRARL
jgi:hypothetical protein